MTRERGPKAVSAAGRKQRRAVALVAAGESYGEAARKVGLTRNAVAGACFRAGLNKGVGVAKKDIDWDAEFDAAQRNRETGTQVARRLGVATSTVYDAADRRSVTLRKGSAARDWDAELSRALEHGETQAQLAKRLGCLDSEVLEARRARGIVLTRWHNGRPATRGGRE